MIRKFIAKIIGKRVVFFQTDSGRKVVKRIATPTEYGLLARVPYERKPILCLPNGNTTSRLYPVWSYDKLSKKPIEQQVYENYILDNFPGIITKRTLMSPYKSPTGFAIPPPPPPIPADDREYVA